MIQSFLKGIFSYGKAAAYLTKKGLWKYTFIPGLISLLLGLGIASIAWASSDNIGQWLVSWYPFELGQSIVSNISTWIGGAIVLVIGLILYKHLVIVLVSPFMSPLSQKIEAQLLGYQSRTQSFRIDKAIKEIWRGLRMALRNITREFLFVVPLFFLSFIPGVGIVASVLLFLVQAFYAGFGNLDYTLERHYNIDTSIQFARQNRGMATGIGTVFLLLLATGVGFLIAPPLAAVAGTLTTVPKLKTINT
ncbi:MAG: EI24 domain-containing protein [Saprospiraceae bacterium]